MEKVKEVFKRCQEHGIMLSEEKVQVGQCLKFGGYSPTELKMLGVL